MRLLSFLKKLFSGETDRKEAQIFKDSIEPLRESTKKSQEINDRLRDKPPSIASNIYYATGGNRRNG
jgi:hypothetical protein